MTEVDSTPINLVELQGDECSSITDSIGFEVGDGRKAGVFESEEQDYLVVYTVDYTDLTNMKEQFYIGASADTLKETELEAAGDSQVYRGSGAFFETKAGTLFLPQFSGKTPTWTPKTPSL